MSADSSFIAYFSLELFTIENKITLSSFKRESNKKALILMWPIYLHNVTHFLKYNFFYFYPYSLSVLYEPNNYNTPFNSMYAHSCGKE